jgi:hypothetical protein
VCPVTHTTLNWVVTGGLILFVVFLAWLIGVHLADGRRRRLERDREWDA